MNELCLLLTCFSYLQVKFITRPEKLLYQDPVQYPQTYCASIICAVNLPPDINAENWWNTFGKTKTREKLTKLRNDRITGLKWAYFSE